MAHAPHIFTPNHWLIITNPKAGKKSFQSQLETVVNALEDNTIPYTLCTTEYAGHAIEIAKTYAEKSYQNFLILGGDGTISEVVNGLLSSTVEDKSILKIAIIPRGTGNDWARFWGITKNTHKNLQCFLAGKSQLIDIGQINPVLDNKTSKYFFINSVGFGLDAHVSLLTNRLKKYAGSFPFLYTISLLIILTRLRTYPISLNINGNTFNFSLLTMNIANGPYSGGGIKQNPDALPYDGIFDMMYVEKITFKDITELIPKLFNGKLKQHKRINSFQTKNVAIQFSEKAPIEADGITLPESDSYTIEILPSAIQMIVP